MITSNSDTFGIFGLKILNKPDLSPLVYWSLKAKAYDEERNF